MVLNIMPNFAFYLPCLYPMVFPLLTCGFFFFFAWKKSVYIFCWKIWTIVHEITEWLRLKGAWNHLFHPSAQVGTPRVACPGLCPGTLWRLTNWETPQHLWATYQWAYYNILCCVTGLAIMVVKDFEPFSLWIEILLVKGQHWHSSPMLRILT